MYTEETLDNIPSSAPLQRSRVASRVPLGWGAKGKTIEWDIRDSPHAYVLGGVGSGRSTVFRNLIAHVTQHPNDWRLLGVDVSWVELAPYTSLDTTLDIGTNVAEGLDVLFQVRDEMYDRYGKIRDAEVNHIDELGEPYQSWMLLVENVNTFLSPVGAVEFEAEDKLRVRAYHALCELLNFGHHAGIHVVLSSHHLNDSLFPEAFYGGVKARILMGHQSTDVSAQFLGHAGGNAINRSARGRGYFQMDGEGEEFQTFFAPQKWFEKFNANDENWLSAWEDDGVDLDTLVV